MKKIFIFVFLLFILLVSACSAGYETSLVGNTESSQEDIPLDNMLIIDERLFVARFIDIIHNPERYIGRIIQYEGMFGAFPYSEGGGYHYVVYRYTEGCCTPSEMVGFEILLDDHTVFPNNTWVEVTGILEELEYWGETFIVVRPISINELDVRGEEFVSSFGF